MKVAAGTLTAFALSILLTAGIEARIVGVPVRVWEIGPIIKDRNYSRGLFRPSEFKDGWGFVISPTREPHYVTFRHGSLTGKKLIKMRFRVEGPKGAIIHGAKCPTRSRSAVTLYFQSRGDNWRSDGARWWASFAKVKLRGPMAETEIVAPLDARWTSVYSQNAQKNPREFAAAKRHADRVGFTFANCEGYGHGARATAPVRFVVTSFQVL